MRNRIGLGLAAAAVMVLAGCGSSDDSATQSTASAATTTTVTTSSKPCELKTTRDIIERDITPRLPPSAIRIGNVDLVHCAPTLDTFREGVPSGPEYCTQLAYADDNPGYDVDAVPAAPLKQIQGEAGDAC